MAMPIVLLRLLESRDQRRDMSFPEGKLNFAWSYLRWQRNARFGRDENYGGSERLTVVLLNYKRPHNIAPIVRSLLRCSFITRIIVCNNNPTYRIADWADWSDERVELVDEDHNTGCIRRFEIARDAPGEFFLALDDDVFLWPWQVKRLFSQLVCNPDVPHGLFGEYILLDYQLRGGIHGEDAATDILSRVYAFTKQHAVAFWALVAELGVDPQFTFADTTQPLAEATDKTNMLNVCDDILLSYSGNGRPVIHNLGRVLCCPTGITAGIATWKVGGFVDYRVKLVQQLLRLRPQRAPAGSVGREWAANGRLVGSSVGGSATGA